MAPVTTTAILLAALAIPLGALALLTGLGSLRRGASWPVAALSAVFFPLAWAAWYVRDERDVAPGRPGDVPPSRGGS